MLAGISICLKNTWRRNSLITCLIAVQLYFAADMRQYSVRTEWYPKIMAIVEAENIILDEDGFKELFGERIPYVESSLAVASQMIGDDGASVGAYQINILGALRREYPLGWTEMDSLVLALQLVVDPYRSQDEAQAIFL